MRFCIILGAMKAGTTSLFNYLAQHPEIGPCKNKEPSFFSHYYKKGIDCYLSLWDKQAIESKVLLEASTNYTKYPSFPDSSRNIVDFSKKSDVSMKFIYILRDPIKRIESQHTYAFARWTDKSLTERIQPNGHLINVSRYAQQLDLYYEDFDHDNFLLLDFDGLVNRPHKLLKKICVFLGIDSNFQFSDIDNIHNESKGKRITKPIDRLYKKYPLLKSFTKLFPISLRQSIQKFVLRKQITKKFKLTEKQKLAIHDVLQDDMKKLHDKYGIDVSKWGF